MIMVLIVVVLMAALVLLEAREAFRRYQEDQGLGKLALHGVLLAVLAIVVVNTAFAIVDCEFKLPYIETHLLQSDPQYLKSHQRFRHHLPKLGYGKSASKKT